MSLTTPAVMTDQGLQPARPIYLDAAARIALDAATLALLAERRVQPQLFRARAAWDAERREVPVDQAVAELAAVLAGAEPGPVMLIPPAIEEALTSPEELIGLFGPARTGKTRGIAMYVYQHCRKYAAKYPGEMIRWLYLRDTFESIRHTTLKSWLELFPVPRFGTWNAQQKTYKIRLPVKGQHAEVLFWGLDDDKDISRLQSLDLTGFVAGEAAGGIGEDGQIQRGIPEGIYRTLLTRLSHPAVMIGERLRGIVESNTGSTTHWTYRVFKPQLAQPHGTTRCAHVSEEESPTPIAYYDGLTEKLGAGSLEELRYRRGLWLKALTGGFHRDMIPIVARDQLPPFIGFGGTCDPAPGGRSGIGDRQAFAMAGFTARGDAYLFDLPLVAGGAEAELLATIFASQQKYGLGAFGFESVNFSTWLSTMIAQQHKIRELSGQVHVPITLIALPRDTQVKKETRIQGTLGVRLAQRRLYIVEGCTNLGAFYQELEAFPDGDTDDLLDAVADLDQVYPHVVPGAVSIAPPLTVGGMPAGGGASPRFWDTRRRSQFWPSARTMTPEDAAEARA